MRSTAARVRRADQSDADLDAVASIVSAVIPDYRTDVEEMQREDAIYPGIVRFIAAADGLAVGAAIVGRIYMQPPAFDAYIGSIAVIPEARRRGVGGALLAEVVGAVRAAGKSALHLEITEDRPEGRAFLLHRGFREYARHKMARLELVGLEPPTEAPPAGVNITTLSERPDLIAGVHAVAVETFADIPGGDDPPVAGDLAEFRARDIDWPTIPWDAFMVALEETEGSVIGYASLVFPAGTRHFAYHDMTTVARAWRGRGVASVLKRATIGWAIRHGLDYLETGNDADNAPMRAINERLGFRPRPDIVTMRAAIADIPADDGMMVG